MERSPLKTKSCSSDKDSFTLESWDDSPPSLFVKFIEPDGKSNIQCYDAKSLYEYLMDLEEDEETGDKEYSHVFYEWVRADPNKPIDSVGKHGKESEDPDEKYWSFPPNNVPVKVDGELLLALVSGIPYYAEVRQNGIKLLGKESSRLALGGWHGQSPGYMTYNVTKLQPLEKSSDQYIPASVTYLVSLLVNPDINKDRPKQASTLKELEKLCGDWSSKECSVDIWKQLIERDLTTDYKGDDPREFYLSTISDIAPLDLYEGLKYAIKNKLPVLRDIIVNDPTENKEGLVYVIAYSAGEFPQALQYLEKLKASGVNFASYAGLVAAAVGVARGGDRKILNLFYKSGTTPQDALIYAVTKRYQEAIPILLTFASFDDIIVNNDEEQLLGILLLNQALVNDDQDMVDELVKNGLDIERVLLEEIAENKSFSKLILAVPPNYTENIRAIVEDLCEKLNDGKLVGTKHIDEITPPGIGDILDLWRKVIELLDDDCYKQMEEENYSLATRDTEIGKVLELKPNIRSVRPLIFD